MTEHLSIWVPTLEGSQRKMQSLAVPWSGPKAPEREEYQDALCQYLGELIASDPKQAERDLEAVDDPRVNPDLSFIRAQSQIQNWAAQISQCDQMEMLLDRIDWQTANPPEDRPQDTLPSLIEILQKI